MTLKHIDTLSFSFFFPFLSSFLFKMRKKLLKKSTMMVCKKQCKYYWMDKPYLLTN